MRCWRATALDELIDALITDHQASLLGGHGKCLTRRPRGGWARRSATPCAPVQRALAAAGVEDAGRDARLLVAAAAGSTPQEIICAARAALSRRGAGAAAGDAWRGAARASRCRASSGEREFYGRRFALSPATLDPRPDTETLIEAALGIAAREGWRERPIRILDVGTGIGLPVADAARRAAAGDGARHRHQRRGAADGRASNAAALGVAAARRLRAGRRARRHRRALRSRRLQSALYSDAATSPDLSPEVREYDPRAALDGGADGLDIYRRIIADLPARAARLGDLRGRRRPGRSCGSTVAASVR